MNNRSFTHRFFGPLKWNKKLAWYTGQVSHSGKLVDLSIEVEREQAEAAVSKAYRQFAENARRDVAFRQSAAKENLPAYNDNWNDGTAIDASEFKNRLSVAWIWFKADGSVEVHYDDDGMFL